MYEGNTGIFGAMQDEEQKGGYQYIRTTDENDPDTIYNLLFKDYDTSGGEMSRGKSIKTG